MTNRTLNSSLLMFLVAIIWGGALVAQRLGMEAIGPFLFSGLRFSLGALAVLPFCLFRRKQLANGRLMRGDTLLAGSLLGLLTAISINLQQVGLLYTQVANAGFITGIYVVFVPLLGLLCGIRNGSGTWLGVGLTAIGLFFLSVQDSLTIASGDWLQLGSAFTWALHVLVLGYFARRHEPIFLAFIQFLVCALLSLLVAFLFESIHWSAIQQAAPALAYAGILSAGLGFTLQAIAQQHVKPAHAAIILSLEGVFAALAAIFVLGEALSIRAWFGALLMLAGMLVAQLWSQKQTTDITRLPGSHP